MEIICHSRWDRSVPFKGNFEGYLCWTRMQAEAGQGLDAIVARKEVERRAGEGLFLWGVGSAPSRAIRPLAQLARHIPVIFSIMRSKPKPTDAAPERIVVWRRYVDKDGVVQALPAHAIVTSRGDSTRGPKRAHYALMCHSDTPLTVRSGVTFDPGSYRNVGLVGAPVGASQVTALLQPSAPSGGTRPYEANMTAELTGSYWVRLVDPYELDQSAQTELAKAGSSSVDDWRALARALRRDEHCSASGVAGPGTPMLV